MKRAMFDVQLFIVVFTNYYLLDYYYFSIYTIL